MKGHDFSKSFGPRTVIFCDQCEKEYHVGCLKEHNMENLKELPKGKWFCCTDCDKIHSALENLVVQGEQKLPDSLLNAIRMKHEEKGSDSEANFDIRWRVLNWKLVSSDESRQLLSKAVSIFHERFDPIVDSASGRDFIPSMIYGRNIRGQDFGGVYCAVLTVNKSVVSAGVFRIFGQEVAELPLVATDTDYQGQGYFQSLFSCIERLLSSLNVRNLVLPAAEEAESIWTNKFGFNKFTQDELNQFKKHYHMVIFQGTSVLQKAVPACELLDGKDLCVMVKLAMHNCLAKVSLVHEIAKVMWPRSMAKDLNGTIKEILGTCVSISFFSGCHTETSLRFLLQRKVDDKSPQDFVVEDLSGTIRSIQS
uniref:N-acetyltransferase domain-containing protein n=1 Tax=Fagus sylvatica TaxID=28930 RepID=A0A2N9EZ32_FAGSY